MHLYVAQTAVCARRCVLAHTARGGWLMDHDSEHSSHDEHGGVHLPDPSVWPLVCGFAALLLGIGLVWWSRDRENNLVGPVAGAGAIAAIIAGAGWAYEDGKMRRKAEQGEEKASTRFTQVVTFAIADGMAETARSANGVLTALNHSDGAVRNLSGFQDLRLTVAPGDTGPLQVIAQTTWANRDGLDIYEESRATLLDVINTHNEEIVPGSVQAFDMEVVRDTKDTSFRYGLGPTAALLGAVLIGGVMVGAGLSIFQDDAAAVVVDGGGGGAPAGDPAKPTLVATDNKFSPTTLTVPANAAITIDFQNKGKVKHNVHVVTAEGGTTLAPGSEGAIIDGGTSVAVSFQSPGAGTYFYFCELHPTEMKGTFVVDASLVAGGGGGGATAGGPIAVTATDNKFDKKTLTAAANSEVVVSFKNSGKVKHNIHFLTAKGGQTLADGAEGAIIDGGVTEEVKFTAPAAGKYFYQCDLHPTEMTGELTVQ